MSMPHAVQFYNDDVFLIDAVSAFITTDIEENATIIVIAMEKHREEIRNALQALGNSGIEDKVLYLDAVELLSGFIVDGWPDQTRFNSTVGGILERAALKGPVRIFGEMVAVLWAEGKTRAALRLEKLWECINYPPCLAFVCVIRCRAFRIRIQNLSFLQVCHAHTHLHLPP